VNTTPALSIVLPTFNRAAELPLAVKSALDQTASSDSYEIIVVDNNSPDRTAEVLHELTAQYPGRVFGVLEKRQGVAYARQAGIDAARAELIGFFDDDVRVAPEWVETILRSFERHPDIEVLGGKVLPSWSAPPPAWLTSVHWAPLALQDFGDAPMFVSRENPRGLISANLACRKHIFERLGGFSPEFQRVKDGIGSLEDDEWIRRLWRSGGRALYVPELVTYTDVPASRLTRAYHRRWHKGHGRFYAMLRADEMERSSVGAFLGVPAHLYRSAAVDVVGWIRAAIAGQLDQAFLHETRLRFFRGFVHQRISATLRGQQPVERLYS
jgi:glycosyltransferase involved in cell wall biosynthesis